MNPNLRTLWGSGSGADANGLAEKMSAGSSSSCGFDKVYVIYPARFVLDQFDFRTFLDAEFSKRLAPVPDHLVQRERSSICLFDSDYLTESETVDP